MDIFNTIKEWISGLFGEQVTNVTENVTSSVEDLQQQAPDVTQGTTDIVDQAKVY